jgi:hypothetical protein
MVTPSEPPPLVDSRGQISELVDCLQMGDERDLVLKQEDLCRELGLTADARSDTIAVSDEPSESVSALERNLHDRAFVMLPLPGDCFRRCHSAGREARPELERHLRTAQRRARVRGAGARRMELPSRPPSGDACM